MKLKSNEQEVEITNVCFYEKGEVESNAVLINHKSLMDKVEQPFFETDKIDENIMLLKIENLNDGDYIIQVNTDSFKYIFDVNVDCKLDTHLMLSSFCIFICIC